MDMKKYLSGKAAYYVGDFFPHGKEDLKYVFFLESPHVDEIKEDNQVPLAGDSGKAVSQFLFGKNEKSSFSEKIKNADLKIGIINISNVPLQDIGILPKSITSKDLSKIRNSKRVKKELYDIFKEKMDGYSLENVEKYIVCGEFASIYVEKYSKEKKWDIEKILKVPHPSRGQWQFIEKNKDNLDELKKLFSEF